jgi:type IX secretion system PorP/SprF family membrane protein
MKTTKLLSALLLVSSAGLFAQDVHFSQSTETPLLLNPSQAGMGHDVLVTLNYKSQWKSVTTPYNTINVGADFAVFGEGNENHMGIGLSVFSDKAGDGSMSTTFGALDISGVLRASGNNLISGGISCGFGQRSLTYGNLTWDNQYDGLHYNHGASTGEPGSFSNYNMMDVSAGLSWYYGDNTSTISSNDARIVSIGFALHHINRPMYSYYGETKERLPMKFVAHGKADIGIKNYSIILEPSYLVMIQAGHHEITPGMMVKYTPRESSKYTGRVKSSAFCLGGYYRHKDALVACLRYEYSNWSAGFSYDINISNLNTASHAKGGFEIALRFMSPDPFGRKNSRKLIG